MPDIYDSRTRSVLMSGIRTRNTKPEMLVRSLLHRMGYRFRLHRRELPGSPDIVLPKHKTVIFVHGCFWHQHEGCRKARRPKSNRHFWDSKLDANVSRDHRNRAALEQLGWRVLTIWECETSHTDEVVEKLTRQLHKPYPRS